MTTTRAILLGVLLVSGVGQASPVLDEKVFGKMLGGWTEKDEKAAKVEVSGSSYRVWKPHVSPTLDGGIFVSVRIDHLRGFLASDDHASLELSFDEAGNVSTAQSTIALQGRKISSDLIQGGTKAGASLVGLDRAAKVGTDLIGNLSSKMLREKVSEPGRVGFPAVLRHSYNLLCLSVEDQDRKAVVLNPSAGVAVAAVPVEEEGGEGESEGPDGESANENGDAPEEEKAKSVPPLEVKEHGAPKAPKLPASPKK